MIAYTAQYNETAKPVAGSLLKVIPAGWSVVKVAGSFTHPVEDGVSYATQEEAEARIPALQAEREARIAAEEREYASSDDFFNRDADNDSTGGVWR